MGKLKSIFSSDEKQDEVESEKPAPAKKKSPKVQSESKGAPDNHHKKWDKFKKGNE